MAYDNDIQSSYIYEFLESIDRKVERFISNMNEIKPDVIGLDSRSAYMLYVGHDCIAVSKDDDRRLQYYGGFEYVDKSSRYEAGSYVFYMGDDDRVAGCIARYYGEEIEDIEDIEEIEDIEDIEDIEEETA